MNSYKDVKDHLGGELNTTQTFSKLPTGQELKFIEVNGLIKNLDRYLHYRQTNVSLIIII